MVLKSLKLTHFRNYSELTLDLQPLILLLGQNAQGKSNMLDAIYFLATSKSLRGERDAEVILEGQEYVRVEGELDEETRLEIAMQLQNGFLAKRLKVNGIPKRVIDYIGNLVVIYFVPEDINLVTGSPSLRRWHLDVMLAQIDREYKRAITNYGDALTSRNRLLKRIREGLARMDELDFWTQQVLLYGATISEKRQHFFAFLKESSPDMGDFHFEYHPNIITPERLEQYLNREVAAATTLIGPHRDDFLFRLGNKELASFGSRGEQRVAVLQLKLSELHYVTEIRQVKPILLLDDVFSELDDAHQQSVAKAVFGQQTVISAVENETIPQEILEKAQILKIEKGSIISNGVEH